MTFKEFVEKHYNRMNVQQQNQEMMFVSGEDSRNIYPLSVEKARENMYSFDWEHNEDDLDDVLIERDNYYFSDN